MRCYVPTRIKTPLACGFLASLVITPGTVQAIDILFDYTFDTNGFFNQDRKNILDSAASFFETRINDSLNAVGSGFFGFLANKGTFTNPQTGNSRTDTISVPSDTLRVYVGGRDLASPAEGKPSIAFGQLFPFFPFNNENNRGESGVDTSGTNDSDFAPWGGAISFDTSTSWYVDTDTSTDESFTGYDMFTVAQQQIGRILGFGEADSWNNQVNGGQFTGTHASTENGGAVSVTTDGYWAANTQSTVAGTNTTQTALMASGIATGERRRVTDLDLAGLQDIGWEIQADSSQ